MYSRDMAVDGSIRSGRSDMRTMRLAADSSPRITTECASAGSRTRSGVMPAFTCSSRHVSTGCEVIPTETVSTPSSCDAPSIATR
jgi:hypothetical protein